MGRSREVTVLVASVVTLLAMAVSVAAETQKVLGLDLAELTTDLRGEYRIKDSVKGVLITGVEDGSEAAKKRLSAGEVIVELAQEAVSNAADIEKHVNQLKKHGKNSVLLLVSTEDGELRHVALSLQDAGAPSETAQPTGSKWERKQRETMERNRAETERGLQEQLAASAERERQRQAALAAEAKVPAGRLRRAYSAYAVVQLCSQLREGYAVKYINDVELERAQSAAKAIENAEIAKDSTIDPDKLFAEGDKFARKEFSNVIPDHRRTYCRSALDELLAKSPVSPFQTKRP